MSVTALRAALQTASPVGCRRGARRRVCPSDTLSRVRPLADRIGVTRLGNITGLDRIGIPVAVAVRPGSRSVSVSQGKGLDLPQAKTSALMEAIEGFHAEHVGAGRRATYREMSAGVAVVDPWSLCATGRAFDPDAVIGWTEGFDLLQQKPCWVPTEIVHTDAMRPLDGYFLAGSNGLASGNDLAEALSAAICELVERDAVALWAAAEIRARAGRPLAIGTIDDPDCIDLLGKYERAGIPVRVWDVTTEIGIAAFRCEIRDPSPGEPGRLRRFHGAGCHPDRIIALLRALTEAAQVRLTYIAGIRNDLFPSEYQEPPHADLHDALVEAIVADTVPQPLDATPSFVSDDLCDELGWELDRLRISGVERVVAVDLTRDEFGVPVVRVVIPGLEGDIRASQYVQGERARRAPSSP